MLKIIARGASKSNLSDRSTQSIAAFIGDISLYRLKGVRKVGNTFDKTNLEGIREGNTI